MRLLAVCAAAVFLAGCVGHDCNTYSGEVVVDAPVPGVFLVFGRPDLLLVRDLGSGFDPTTSISGTLEYSERVCSLRPEDPVLLRVFADLDDDAGFNPGAVEPGDLVEEVEFPFGDGDQETDFVLAVP